MNRTVKAWLMIAMVAGLTSWSLGQDQNRTVTSRTTSVSVMEGPDGQATMNVVTDGVPQVFVTNENGEWVAADGSDAQPPMAGGAGGMIFKTAPGGAPGGFVMPKGGGGFVGGGAGGKVMTPDLSQIKQKLNQSLKDLLGCSDDEWAVLGPKIDKIRLLQGAVGERTGMAIVGAGGNKADVPAVVTDVNLKQTEFQKLVSTKETPDRQVQQALIALRDARAKARVELKQARKDLVDLLTPRQEAVLYQYGVLEQ